MQGINEKQYNHNAKIIPVIFSSGHYKSLYFIKKILAKACECEFCTPNGFASIFYMKKQTLTITMG